MKNFFDVLNQYVAENQPSFGDGESVLTLLYEAYSECNRLDDAQIKADFNELYRLKTQTEACSDVKTLQALAACDGEKGAVLLANYSGDSETVGIEMPGWKIVSCLVIDDLHTNEELPFIGEIPGNCTMLLLTEKL